MTIERLKYTQRRQNRDGTERWYWRKPGFPIVRLPDDRSKRIALVDKLNGQAERVRVLDTADDGTLEWVIRRYKESDRFRDLASESTRIYERWLGRIGTMWGTMPPKVLTRRVVVTWIDEIPGRASRGQAAAVLYNLLEVARRHGMVEINMASRLGISAPKPREAP